MLRVGDDSALPRKVLRVLRVGDDSALPRVGEDKPRLINRAPRPAEPHKAEIHSRITALLLRLSVAVPKPSATIFPAPSHRSIPAH
ncbi:MAG: hypothetical protein OXU92_03385, partial [Deltaproteobacteria bacterium]|nr:hypothetical protein [Deltaproteobacteria bacterium]